MSIASRDPKQFRARTGCLTCRDRHIKCDEAIPRCRNCTKSDRICERGIRLNFIDIQTTASQPLTNLPPGTQLVFRDESHTVASGYTVAVCPDLNSQKRSAPPKQADEMVTSGSGHGSQATPVESLIPSSRLINKFDESLLMEVFIEKVGPWMDCLDPTKPFTTIVPFYALSEDTGTVHNAMMACGARYLMPIEPSLYQARAIHNIQQQLTHVNKDNTLQCVVTAVLLNACDAMSDAGIDYNHLEQTAALIRNADIDGTSSGLEAACFWFIRLMSLVYGLRTSLPLAGWDPDQLKFTMDAQFASSGEISGEENRWAQRMVYICTKVVTLGSSVSQNTCGLTVDQLRRYCEEYKGWCDDWANSVPRSMMPLCYIPPASNPRSDEEDSEEGQTPSVFPHILLVKPCATVARLLYHTSCLLLASAHLMLGSSSMAEGQLESIKTRHALDICGIASQAEEKEFAYIAIWCLLIASESLNKPQEVKEAAQILDRITGGTPWKAQSLTINKDIQTKGYDSSV